MSTISDAKKSYAEYHRLDAGILGKFIAQLYRKLNNKTPPELILNTNQNRRINFLRKSAEENRNHVPNKDNGFNPIIDTF